MSDSPEKRPEHTPNFRQTSAAADGRGIDERRRQGAADQAAGLDAGPAASTGAKSAEAVPQTGAVPPPSDPTGRVGADTGAGSEQQEGYADADSDPASGALGDRGRVGAGSPSRNRVQTQVSGAPMDPLVGGAARNESIRPKGRE